MKNQSKNYEILAPAGNAESLIRAVQCGADAVYLGLNKFNARMKAENFSIENLRKWTDYCHLFGVKVFVTVNTSLKSFELEQAKELLSEIYNCYADGVILTDLALIEFSAKHFPKPFEIIASTQLNIHDVYGAKFVESLGATKVVLARETPYESIKDIIEQTSLSVECFIHGAMCVSQSGQCLLSSLVGGNSGNRGLCAQPCRQYYDCLENGTVINGGYLLSTKDLCGLTTAKKLYDAGVKSFKIEGRNRRSQYSGLASHIYSKLFENDFIPSEGDINRLSRVFNRGNYLSTEYLQAENDNIIHPKTQGHIGLEVGTYKQGKLHLSEECEAGDGFKILRDGFEVGNATATQNGKAVTCSANGQLRDGDTVCITSDLSQLREIDQISRKLLVKFYLTAKANSNLHLKAEFGDITVDASSHFVCEKAKTKATSKIELCEQLQKTGNSYYTISDIVVYLDDVFVPKSVINSLRREVLDKLTESILCTYVSKPNRSSIFYRAKSHNKVCKTSPKVAVICRNLADFSDAISDQRLSHVILRLSDINVSNVKKFADISSDKVFYLDIPSFAELDYVANVLVGFPNLGIVANSVGAVNFAIAKNIPYLAGLGLNIFNNENARILSPNNQTYIVSQELTLNEAQNEFDNNWLQFVDGEITVMKLQHCPNKLNRNQQCESCSFTQMQYVDKFCNSFFIQRVRCPKCSFNLINGKKLSATSRLKSAGNYLVDYSKQIVEHYLALNNGIDDGYIERQPYTKGRLYDKIN